MSNKIDYLNLIDGLNLNPISLETGNEMTTAKWLMGMQKTLNEMIAFTNGWYDTILKDLENNGKLYDSLSGSVLNKFNYVLGNKVIYIDSELPPLESRNINIMYFKVTDDGNGEKTTIKLGLKEV